METKRQRQSINRSVGLTGSFMPIERAESIARKEGLDSSNSNVINQIRVEDQSTKRIKEEVIYIDHE